MSSVDFHQKLNYLAAAEDPDELANRVLGKSLSYSESASVNEEVAKNVSSIIEKFLDNNKNEVASYDLNSLRKLQFLAHTLSKGSSFSSLEKTVEKMIDLMKETDAISKSIKQTLDINTFKIDVTQVPNFVNSMRAKEKVDLQAFEEFIFAFFRVADESRQNAFFSCLKEGDEKFLTKIIDLLPKEMTFFSASSCSILKDSHVKTIVNRLTKLNSLNLPYCWHLTDRAVDTAVAGSKEWKLLNFEGCPQISKERQAKVQEMLQKK